MTAAVLVPYLPSAAQVVLGWVTSDDEARRWASLSSRPTSADIFERWHAEPGVRAYFLEDETGRPIAYGEIWEDADENEAELARLIVDPEFRGWGMGRRLVHELLVEASRRGWDDVWLRVEPDNEPALRCYAAAGFVRASPDEAAAFNAGQPADYVWMRASG